MEFLTVVYLVYAFIALYFVFLFLLLYISNSKRMQRFPKITENYSLSMVVPCFNEEKEIGNTIMGLVNSDYKNLKQIIVVDDCSTDNSYKVIKKYVKKYPGKVKLVQTPKNTGCAAGAKNYGSKFVKTELIGFTDSDSIVTNNAISRMIGYFDDKKVGVVASMIFVKRDKENYLEKIQAIEYKIIAFSRKLLQYVDAIYVTPGPLAIYRRSAFENVGKFDEKNLTEDIEITWNMASRGYLIRMASYARVFAVSPYKIKPWFKQRIRWNLGGLQTTGKYAKDIFRKGVFGNFIIPFFILSWFIGSFGLAILAYRGIRFFVLRYLTTSYLIGSQATVLSMQDINLTPNVLVFFGIITIVLNFLMVWASLVYGKEKERRENIFMIFFYMFFYVLIYPIVLVLSIYKFFKRDFAWGTR